MQWSLTVVTVVDCAKNREIKNLSKKSYLVKIIGIVANQMIPVEIYENFQRLGILDIYWNTCPDFRSIIFE